MALRSLLSAVLWAPCLILGLVAAEPGSAEEALVLPQVRIEAEFGPTAPAGIVRRFQDEAALRLPRWMAEGPASGAVESGWSVELEETPRGVILKMETAADVDQAAQAFRQPLAGLLEEVGGAYTTRLEVVPSAGSPERTSSWMAYAAAVGAAVLLLGGLGATVARRRVSRAPRASLWGLPVVGVLPESLLRLGRLYHLQAKPCQAMAWFFAQRAEGRREVLLSGPTLEAAAVVAVGLAVQFARRGERVLLVDVAGSGEVFQGVLARFGPQDGEAAVPLASALPGVDHMALGERPARAGSLPEELTREYRHILLVLPDGPRPLGVPVLEIVHRVRPFAALALLLARRSLGWVLIGDAVPERVSDAYYTRYYYERLHDPAGPSHALA
ncbi:MAG: hypothetical protein VKO21_03490 [Candidatus Sericytochromatia bacterium]|nr:hypothetical protein [Candidatus Sericytochromatia bacterium]